MSKEEQKNQLIPSTDDDDNNVKGNEEIEFTVWQWRLFVFFFWKKIIKNYTRDEGGHTVLSPSFVKCSIRARFFPSWAAGAAKCLSFCFLFLKFLPLTVGPYNG